MAKTQPNALMTKRLERLVKGGFISGAESARFLELEEFVDHGTRGEGWESCIDSYHKTNGEYMPMLRKVLEALVAIKEPYAAEKHREFMGEMGIMVPDVFCTPWDMTLRYLDEHVGNAEEVARFYSL